MFHSGKEYWIIEAKFYFTFAYIYLFDLYASLQKPVVVYSKKRKQIKKNKHENKAFHKVKYSIKIKHNHPKQYPSLVFLAKGLSKQEGLHSTSGKCPGSGSRGSELQSKEQLQRMTFHMFLPSELGVWMTLQEVVLT